MKPPTPMPPLYKVLVDGESKHFQTNANDPRHYRWSLPSKNDDGSWTPGDWHEVEGEVVLCHNGLHVTPEPLDWWLDGCVVYRVEAEGIVGDPTDKREDPQGRRKVAAKRVRLLYPIDMTARLDAHRTALLEREAAWRQQAEEDRARFLAETPLREAKNAEYQKKADADAAVWAKRKARDDAARAAQKVKERAEHARVLALTPTQRARERKAGTITLSPVMQAVVVFERNIPGGSDRRLNDGLYDVVKAAIESRMPFDQTDIEDFFRLFRAAEWFDADRLYVLAVEKRHRSACRAIEHHLGRKPWIVQGVRLAVGSRFEWCGARCEVTSFNDRTDTLTACSYKSAPRGRYTDRVLHKRFKVTRDEFQQAFHGTPKARKESSNP